jgi:hypothetical protein
MNPGSRVCDTASDIANTERPAGHDDRAGRLDLMCHPENWYEEVQA